MLTTEIGTWTKYESAGRLYIKPLLEHLKLQDLRRAHCQEFANRLQGDLSPKYIHNIIGALTACLNDAIKRDLILRNPASELDLPRVYRRDPLVMDDDIQRDFEKEAMRSPYRNVFLAAIHTGMRISEVLGLRWKNINMTTGEIIIDSQLERNFKGITGRGIKETTKNHRKRSMFIPNFVIEEVFKTERRQQAERKLKFGEDWSNEDGLIFTRADGSPMPHRTIENAFKRIVTRIGHPELTLHALRRTYITNEETAGIDIKTISDTVGHSASAITLDVYTAASTKKKREVANRRQAEHEKRNASS